MKNNNSAKGRIISFSQKDVVLPGGRRSRIDVIRHPGASLIIPFLKDKVIMLRQWRPVVGRYMYELPAGTLNPGESPYLCARREVAEETGFTPLRLKKLGFIYPVPGYSTEKIHIYQATGLRKTRISHDEDEVIETVVFGKAQVRNMFKNGRINDAKTICALTLCGWL